MTRRSAFTDPSVTGPNLRFNDGTVRNGVEQYNPQPSAAPGGHDPSWSLTQWSSGSYLDPALQAAGIVDPLLGASVARWQTADGLNGVTVFGRPGDYTYRLSDDGGELKDLLLQTVTNASLDYSFDRQVTFTALERIVSTRGGVLDGPTQIANNVTVAFNRPGSPGYDASLPTLSMFLQFPLANESGLPQTLVGNDMYNIGADANDRNQVLEFAADNTRHRVTIDLSSAVAQMSRWLHATQYTAEAQAAGGALLDLSRWSLSGLYIGAESLGASGVAMDVAHPVVTRDDSRTVTSATVAASPVSVSGGLYFNGSSSLPQAAAYSVDGAVYVVGSLAGATASIDTGSGSGPFTVFGGASDLDYTGGAAVIVLNAAGDSGRVSIDSTGGNQVWAGSASIRYTEGGHSRFILGATPGLDSHLTLSGGVMPASNEIDILGAPGDVETIDNTATGPTTVFGGNARLVYDGGDSLLVLNGLSAGQADVSSTGGDTVWAGAGALVFREGGGNDTLILGDGSTTVDGATREGVSGSSRILGFSGSGRLEYDGGAKAAGIHIGAQAATIFAGSAEQDITLDGAGRLVVVAAASSTGLQTVTVGPDATGSLQFWGGGAGAQLVLGAANAWVSAGAGNMRLTSGSGGLQLNLRDASHASVQIDGASAGHADLFGFTPATASVSITNVSDILQGSLGLVVELKDGNSVTFHGVQSQGGILFG